MTKFALALFFSIFMFSVPLMAANYTVYCANGKIEVDMRPLDQMISARGKGTYAIVEFNNRTDADKAAKSGSSAESVGNLGCR